jgi:hypothetical protein
MISSRNQTVVAFTDRPTKLTDLRRELKQELLAAALIEWHPFEVWINEDETADAASDTWEHSVTEVAKADIVVVLYDGTAGWSVAEQGVGICHAEMKRALDMAPAKVRVVELPFAVDMSESDVRFRTWVDGQRLWRVKAVDTSAVVRAVKQAVVDTVGVLVHIGSSEGRRGKYHSGGRARSSHM